MPHAAEDIGEILCFGIDGADALVGRLQDTPKIRALLGERKGRSALIFGVSCSPLRWIFISNANELLHVHQPWYFTGPASQPV